MMAFALYLGLPKKELDDRGEAVRELASSLDRTPNSVSLKIWNIAAHDENRLATGRVGMSHGSKLDAWVWDEYNKDEEMFLAKCLGLLPPKVQSHVLNEGKYLPETKLETTLSDLKLNIPEGTIRHVVQAQRVNQSYFRNSLLANYGGKCCVTGIAIPQLLVASHIKPWSASDSREKTMASNGLLLNAFHDCAFDRGLMTLDDNYCILINHEQVGHDSANDRWLYAYEVNWSGFCSAFIVRRLVSPGSYSTRFRPARVSCSPGWRGGVSSS
ncbi:HNH endonuclease, partial [Bifidobacterium animalis]